MTATSRGRVHLPSGQSRSVPQIFAQNVPCLPSGAIPFMQGLAHGPSLSHRTPGSPAAVMHAIGSAQLNGIGQPPSHRAVAPELDPVAMGEGVGAFQAITAAEAEADAEAPSAFEFSCVRQLRARSAKLPSAIRIIVR